MARTTLLLICVCATSLTAVAQDAGGWSGGGEAPSLDWLAANPGDPDFASGLDLHLSAAGSLDALDAVRERLLPLIPDLRTSRHAARSLADLYFTARQLELARDMYDSAFQVSSGADVDSLFARALVDFELGDLDRADAAARQVLLRTEDYSLKRRAYTLVARCAFARDEWETSLQMLRTLASLADDPESGRDSVEVESLLLLHQVLEASGDAQAAGDALELLRSVFPLSIAAELSSSGGLSVVSPGLPATMALLGRGAEDFSSPDGDSTVPEVARRPQPRFSAVQVGSFTDEDNAVHLAADLKALELQARVETVAKEGTSLYQVVVDIPDGSTESAARLFAVLGDNGFDGFLVY